MEHFALFADVNDDINKWLGDNPLILGLLFLLIGLVVGGWGLYELFTGVAYSKRGRAMTGTQGKVIAIIRLVAGVGCILFALFKIVAG